MKKFLIILAVIVGILLCIFHNEVNTIMFLITNGGQQKFEEKLTTGSPKEVEKLCLKALKLKVLGNNITHAGILVIYVGKNPNPAVLKTILDTKEIDKSISKAKAADIFMFNTVLFTDNSPEKVKILLEYGYDPYKVSSANRSAMDIMKDNYNKIDPKVFDVIREHYGY